MELDEHIVIKGLKLRFSLRPASFLLSSSLAVPGPVIHCIQCPSQAHTIKVPTGMPGYICTLDLWHMDSAFFLFVSGCDIATGDGHACLCLLGLSFGESVVFRK